MKRTTPTWRRTAAAHATLLALAALLVLLCQSAARAQSPTGPAGGDLTGTYPNPALAEDRVRTAGDSMTGGLSITMPNTGGIVTPFILKSPGNSGAGRGLSFQFHLPLSASSVLGAQINSAWDTTGKTYLGFSAYNGMTNVFSEVLRVSGGGFVGIGTTSPTSRLHVASNTDSATTLLHLESGTSTTRGGAAFAVSSNATSETGFDLSVKRAGAYASRFGVSAAGNVYLQPGGAGGVGVGTSAPDATLDVQYTANDGTAGLKLGRAGVARGYIFSDSDVRVGIDNNNDSAINAFSVYNNGNVAGELFRVQEDGEVGVGTSAPGFRLDVQGGQVNASGGLCIAGVCKSSWGEVAGGSQWATTGTSLSYTGGAVGIGTAAPNSALEVRAANAFAGTSFVGSGTNLGNLVVLSTDAQGADVGGMLSLGGNRGTSGFGVFGGVRGAKENATDANSAGYLGFYTLQSGVAFAERMRVTSGGNVGVGTSSPTAKLDVAGQIRSSSGGFVFPDGTVQTTATAGGTLTGVTAGAGLTGGGTGGSVTLNFAAGAGLSAGADSVSVNYGSTSGTAVQGNTTLTVAAGQGMSGGGALALGAGGTLTLTNADRGSAQNIFKGVANAAGAVQFSAGSNSDALRFEGTGGTSVSFDAAARKVTINSSTGSASGWTDGGASVTLTNAAAKVGIGASAPNSALEVRDSNAFAGTSVAGSGTGLGNLVVLSTDAQGADVGGMLSLGGNRGASGFGVFGGVRGAKENATDGTSAGYLGFYTLQQGANFGERMRVASNGNVGVGTSSPTAKLDVAGQVRSSSGGFVFPDATVQTTAAAASGWTDTGGSVTLTSVADSVGIGGAPAGLNRLHVHGDVKVEGTLRGGVIEAQFQDLAEWVPSSQRLKAGTVVVLDTERTNQVLASTSAYDTKVAGVVSARPGIALGVAGEGKVLVATTGRVRVRVNAAHAPIKIGDLLVTSDVEGVAMKSEAVVIGGRRMHAPGTIIGKALEPLEKGTGEILVLLSLQ